MNPFLRHPSASQRTPLRAERPEPKVTADGVVTLRLYDPLDSWGGEWGVSAKEFANTLDALPDDTKEIRLLINSPGGEVWEGLAVLNALRAHPAKVVAVVEGIAASSASFIAAGADELEVMPNAELFIHKAWGGCLGNADDMQKMSADLSHEDRNLASIYAGKAGGEVDEWMTRMADETFFSADEAVEAGIADRVVKPAKGRENATESAKARFDLSVFARHDGARSVSNRLAPVDEPATEPTDEPVVEPLDAAPELPAVEPEQPNEPKEDPVSDLSEFRSRLDLPADADEAAILAALDAKLAEPTEPVIDPIVEAEAEAAKAENADLRKEVELVSARMEALAGELAATKAEKALEAKNAFLDAAQKQGKFKPSDRAQWESDYDEAPAAVTRMLDRIEPGTAVPVNLTGSIGSPEPTDDMSTFEADLARLDGPVARKAN